MTEQKLPRGITQRGSSFLAQASKDGRRLYATCATLEEAITKQRELKLALFLGEDALEAAITAKKTRRVWTLKQAFDCTLENVWAGTRSEKTARINAKAVLKFFGEDTKLTDITKERIDQFVKRLLSRGNSGATANRKLANLSKMLKEALKRPSSGYTSLDKPHFDFQNESKGRLRWLTEDEERVLLGYARMWGRFDHLDALVVLLDTGMRLGELWELRGSDVDTTRRVIMVYGSEGFGTKNGDFRAVPMTSRVKEVIERRLKTTNGKHLFPYDKEWLYRFWDKARDCMEMDEDPQFVPHVLRHTCASRLVQRGVPIRHVQVWMGHKSIETTLRYAKLAPDDLLRIVGVLEPAASAT